MVVFNIFLNLQADFIQSVMNLTEGLNQLSLNDSEMALFSAAVLLSPDRPVINDPKTIGQHQERITDALRLQVTVQYPLLVKPEYQLYLFVLKTAFEESRQRSWINQRSSKQDRRTQDDRTQASIPAGLVPQTLELFGPPASAFRRNV